MKKLKNIMPGLILIIIISIVSTYLGKLVPIIGEAAFGIIVGIIINNCFMRPESTDVGIKFTSKKILQWAVILLGANLSLTEVGKTGLESLAVTVFTVAAAFITAFTVGKFLKIPEKIKTLIGVGTAICGGSAIAAVSPIIEADDTEIAYSISTIFLFNIVAVFIFPPLGHLLGFSDKAFGLWAGTAINDTSSVVAAGYAFSNIAGDYATIVKLTRSILIIPISLVFAFIMLYKKKKEKKENSDVNFSFVKIFPWFILWFLVASLLNTLGVFKGSSAYYITTLGKFMIVMALSAIGLSTDFKKMKETGIRPVILGLIVWVSVIAVSLIVQFMLGQV